MKLVISQLKMFLLVIFIDELEKYVFKQHKIRNKHTSYCLNKPFPVFDNLG